MYFIALNCKMVQLGLINTVCGLCSHTQNHAYYAGIMLDALHTYYAKIMYAGIIDSGLNLRHTHKSCLLCITYFSGMFRIQYSFSQQPLLCCYNYM